MMISLIAAVAENRVIGAEGDLPWHLPDDMKFFSRTTRGHHVLMGRKNFESIPARFRPLPGRPNILVTRNERYTAEGVKVVHDLTAGIEYARDAGEEELFIIGGAEIYKQSLNDADRLYITHVHGRPSGNVFFPDFDASQWHKKVLEEHPADAVHNFSFTICVYDRK